MSDHEIDYDQLVRDAMRGVIARLMKGVVEANGLPGEHHFYIVFDTTADGVKLSSVLKAQYSEEMTIVLQHQYSDLFVNDERFEISLNFNGKPERLVIPFPAIKAFVDPSVPYGFQLEPENSAPAQEPSGVMIPPQGDAAKSLEKAESDENATASIATLPLTPVATEKTVSGKLLAEQVDHDDEAAEIGAKVVELDAFRKK